MPNPDSFHLADLREQPAGYYFAIISDGTRVMPSYAARIPLEDRWAIVAYIRLLSLHFLIGFLGVYCIPESAGLKSPRYRILRTGKALGRAFFNGILVRLGQAIIDRNLYPFWHSTPYPGFIPQGQPLPPTPRPIHCDAAPVAVGRNA